MSGGASGGADVGRRARRRQLRRPPRLARQWAFAVSARRLSTDAPDLLLALDLGRSLRRHGIGVEVLGPGRWYTPGPDTEVVVALTHDFEPLRSAVPAVAWPVAEPAEAQERRDLSAYLGRLGPVPDGVSVRDRADALVEGVATALRSPARVEVGVIGLLPDYRTTNPYQAMLLGGLPDLLPVAVTRPTELLAVSHRAQPRILHVHWTAPVLARAGTAEDATMLADRFLAELDEVRREGVAVVWTVHNVLPHDCRFPAVEAQLCQGLADRVDLVHVMGRETLTEAAAAYTIADDDRLVVVPHASYDGIYPAEQDPGIGRRALGLGADDRVVLFLGQIRPYKGLDDLLDAWQAPGRDPRARLVVAGAVGDFAGSGELVERLGEVADRVDLRVVSDDELPTLLAACDVVVLPHRAVLNSGTLLLAHTFGRPVIAPDVGCLRSHAAAGAVRWFGPGHGSLAETLQDLGPLTGDDVRRAARERALRYTPEDMGAAFAAALAGLPPD